MKLKVLAKILLALKKILPKVYKVELVMKRFILFSILLTTIACSENGSTVKKDTICIQCGDADDQVKNIIFDLSAPSHVIREKITLSVFDNETQWWIINWEAGVYREYKRVGSLVYQRKDPANEFRDWCGMSSEKALNEELICGLMRDCELIKEINTICDELAEKQGARNTGNRQ